MLMRALQPGVCKTFTTGTSQAAAGGGADAPESTIPVENGEVCKILHYLNNFIQQMNLLHAEIRQIPVAAATG